MNISILHPFTPQAVGLKEKKIISFHSQPHAQAMRMLSRDTGWECHMDYFTSRLIGRTIEDNYLKYQFYPVDFTWNGDYKKWKKQTSSSCLRQFKKNSPDLTIINMSGHSSQFSFDLSRIIKRNQKQYVAMLGGQHYTNNKSNRLYYRDANHILVHSYHQKSQMEGMELFKDLDIRVFPLGVDLSTFTPGKSNSLRPSLLFVGRIVELKGIELAIKALKTLVENNFPNSKFTAIGPVSSPKYFLFLQEMVKTLGLERNVTFLGQKSHVELPTYFQQDDLSTLPSPKETFGMVMIEAMACGTPVAAISGSGGPEDVIEHGSNGILTSQDNYSEEVLKFFQDKEYSQKMAIEAKRKVEQEYGLTATYEALKQTVKLALG